ncbi:MAG: ComF family protein [Hyphomicrobiaceae bacterium]
MTLMRSAMKPLAPVLDAGRAGGLAVADLLVPAVCISCFTTVWEHDTLCPGCWRSIDFIRPPLCDVLGIPLPYDSGGRLVSAAALAAPPAYRRARAVAHYGDRLRELVHGLKYGDQHHGGRLFGRWLASAGADLLTDANLIVPVPLARLRLWRRRFNQAAVLARAVAVESGTPVSPLVLKRTKSTRSQVGLTSDQRRRNVQGAFSVPAWAKPLVAGRQVLLIDDVITTGSTIDAAARALLGGGAAAVDVLALAIVTGEIPQSA